LTETDTKRHLRELIEIDRRLDELEEERARLLSRKAEIETGRPASTRESPDLSSNQKITLFRSLFIGREDIYAVRWENKSGKSGYAIACSNEWHPDICNKPRVKCSECANGLWENRHRHRHHREAPNQHIDFDPYKTRLISGRNASPLT
jgi:hypothetical protein